jgi:hypothetical protein
MLAVDASSIEGLLPQQTTKPVGLLTEARLATSLLRK